MRLLLLLALASASLAGTLLPHHNEVAYFLGDTSDDSAMNIEENADQNQRSAIISWKLRQLLRELIKQMPCGSKEYNIPPLAPLKKREAELSLKRGILDTTNKVFRFRIDGLNDIKIKSLNLNVLKSTMKFDFIFRNIKISADKYETNTIVDALHQLGLKMEYEGQGSLELALKKLRVAGVLKYKLPILWGSAKITSLKTAITLEKCSSNITGLMGGAEAINDIINHQIENFVETQISKTDEISDFIEGFVVPEVNKKLKGKDFWTIIDYIFSKNEDDDDIPIVSNCVPPADPWN